MTISAQMAEIAFWMMVGGVGVFALAVFARLMSGPGLDRGTLAKPIAIVGFIVAMSDAFLRYWLDYW